ncbi:adenylyl-sulfate kinase [Streptomonospora salina]|uniref:Adenylyl-sulfate kinase n=1 Tax=Streptomonospora salina TaxID=104205 RepID=A0A841EGL7_9ACTN|nr:adenylyl-sulfate kinase [Streptomonospora salina]MBB5999540.1 sulfate adenylyltransferase [Streptomonospora salina]
MSDSGDRSGGEAAAQDFAPDPASLAHLELILSGAYPLAGFMTREEADSVTKHGRLPDGSAWPVPVTLPVPDALADAERLTLTDPEGAPLAELRVRERWWSGAEDPQDGDGAPGHRLAGEVRFCQPPVYGALRHLRSSPEQVRGRRELAGDGGIPVLAVVTDRPLHHRELHRIRAAADDTGGGARAEVLVIIDAPLESAGTAPVVLAAEPLLPAPARFVVATLPRAGAGGSAASERRELLRAHVAAAYGATRLLALGDPVPAGDELPVPAVRAPDLAYDTAQAQWRPAGEVEPGAAARLPDEAEVEETLALGRELPAWFTPARVAAELARIRPPRTERGLTVFFTGLSGSGKSTIARGVAEGIRKSGRTLTLLDGDVVRRMLSAGLTFSRADRDMNVRRIGYVASEVARHGGVAVCAPIAPYAATRAEVRAMVEEVGDFFLVHVATPLEVCEERDRKGLYAKARAGEIPEFTGISDPYEEPEDAELVLGTEGRTVGESVAEALDALRAGGWLPTEQDRGAENRDADEPPTPQEA